MDNYIFFFFSESSPTFTNYDTGFARENMRLEKDVLSKLGVGDRIHYLSYLIKYFRGRVNYMFFQWEIDFGHPSKIQGRNHKF